MTVFDVRCDLCGTALPGPAAAVQMTYHPGDVAHRDNSGLLCDPCWTQMLDWLGSVRGVGRCARCDVELDPALSLHVQGGGDLLWWQLCKPHAVEFLNGLRTVEPKLDVEGFTLAGDWTG